MTGVEFVEGKCYCKLLTVNCQLKLYPAFLVAEAFEVFYIAQEAVLLQL